MNLNLAPEYREKAASEVRNVSLDLSGKLDDGELLTGTPTVEPVSPSDLTIANAGLNTAAITINGNEVAISKAVQFRVSGGTVGKHRIRVTVSTNSTPVQTLIGVVSLRVIADS